MKKSFVLYYDQHECIEDLTNEQKGQLLDMMFLYGKGEDLTECEDMSHYDPVVKLAFKFFKIVFDRDNAKWEKKANRNKENGKKGGRPKGKNDPVSHSGKIVPREIENGHFIYLIKDISNDQFKIGETQNLYNRRHSIKRPTADLEVYDFAIKKDFECREMEIKVREDYKDFIISGDWLDISEDQAKEISLLINPDGSFESQHIPEVTKEPVSVNVSSNVSVNASVNARKIPANPPDISGFSPELIKFVTDFQNHVKKEKGKQAPEVTDKLIKECCSTVDKLIRIDKFTIEEVRHALQWGLQDNFYSGQLFSLASLRVKKGNGEKKFQNLYNQFINSTNNPCNQPDLLDQEFSKIRKETFNNETGNPGARIEIS